MPSGVYKHTKEQNEKMQKTKKEKYANGLLIGPMTGKRHSLDVRIQMSISQKKRFAKAEECEKASRAQKKRFERLEEREKASQRQKEKLAKGEILPPFLGKHHSMQSCKQMSETRKEKINNGEIKIWHKGRIGVYSEETLQKMSKAKKGKKPTKESIEKGIKTRKERIASGEIKINISRESIEKGKRTRKERFDRGEIASPMKGKKHTFDTRKKMSIAQKKRFEIQQHPNKGKKFSPETCAKISKANLGRIPWNKGKTNVYCEETLKIMSEIRKKDYATGKTKKWNLGLTKDTDIRLKKAGEKISLANKGRKWTEEQRKNLSKAISGINHPMYGKKFSKEWCNNLSISHKGKRLSKETCDKMSKNSLGKKRSLQAKQNMRLSAIKRIENTRGQIRVNYNPNACKFFNEINQKYNLIGLHAENIGEIHIKDLGYFLDYYEPFLNLVIEFNERKHYSNQKKIDRDKQREREIRDFLKCEFITINEKKIALEKEFIYKRIEKIIENKNNKFINEKEMGGN